ncbi:MAG: enoyl-CoA hydratase/isomerase family protein [Rhodospirillales bacterium]|nr:enoyl-CoA hydratase/isomerase family protein [Rhodospirillales bacterium]
MSDEPVLLERIAPVGYLTLNRPDKLNAIGEERRKLLVERIDGADADPDSCDVVIRGGGRAFCPGDGIPGDGAEDAHDREWREVPADPRGRGPRCGAQMAQQSVQ